MVGVKSSAEQSGFGVGEFSADNLGVDINSSEIFAGVWNSLPPEMWQKINFMMEIGKWILVATLAYLIIKIIFQFMKIKDSANLATIALNTKNMNAKIDALMHRKKIN